MNVLLFSSLTDSVLTNLNDLIRQEVDLIYGVEEVGESIDWQLRMMYAVLQDAEAVRGPSNRLLEWNEIVENANLSAENAIEQFIISDGAKSRGFFKSVLLVFQKLKHRHKVGTQLNRIKDTIKDKIHRAKSATGDGEEKKKLLSAATLINSALTSFITQILRTLYVGSPTGLCCLNVSPTFGSHFRSLLDMVLVDHPAESVRRDFDLMKAFLSDIEGMKDLANKESVWVKNMKNVAEDLDRFFQKLAERRGFFRRPMNANASITQFRSEISELFKRKIAYEIEVFGRNRGLVSVTQDQIATQSSISATSDIVNHLEEEAQPRSSLHHVTRENKNRSWFLNILVLLYTGQSVEEQEKQVESIRADSTQLHAIVDVFAKMENPDERMNVWVREIEELIPRADKIIDAYDKKIANQRKGFFRDPAILDRMKVEKEIKRLKNRIADISRKRMMYEIGGNGSSGVMAHNSLHATAVATLESVTDQQSPPFTTLNRSKERRITFEMFPGVVYELALDLEDQVKSFNIEIEQMRALLEDYRGVEIPNRRLKIWLELINGLEEDAENVRKTYRTMTSMQLNKRAKIAADIRRIMNKIDGVSKLRKASNSYFHTLCEDQEPPSVENHIADDEMVDYDDDVLTIKQRLLTDDDCCHMIIVVGEEGTGLSTLADSIYRDDDIVDNFPSRALVSVPQESNESMVLDEIRKQIMGLVHQKGKWIEGAEPLSSLNERCLIVLDNVRTDRLLNCIREVFLQKSIGSRVVITTQEMFLASSADWNQSKISSHKIGSLSEIGRWRLFVRTLKKDIPPELEDLGKEIMIKCGQRRKDIVRMAMLLSKDDVTRKNWERVLKLPDTLHMELSRNLRKCLQYFRLFPKDFEIPARRLITLWVAEGFVNKRMGDEPPEQIAKRYLKELIDQQMVQVVKKKFDGDVKTCCLSKEKGVQFLQYYDDATSRLSSKIYSFADHLNIKDPHFRHIHSGHNNIPPGNYYKYVLSFLSFDHRKGSKPGEDVGKFLERCISIRCFLLLRVLDLERVFRPKFPDEFGKLLQLRYLGLRWTYLEQLPPFVSNFLKLQTLDVKNTYISTLPHSIWKMQLLRHLYLSESYRSRFMPKPRSSSLTELQTLWGLFIDEESPVKNGLDTLLNLRKLGIACRIMLSQKQKMSSQIDGVANWIQKLEHLQSLRLKSFDEDGKPWLLRLESLSELKNLSSMYLLGTLEDQFVETGIPESLTHLTLSASQLKRDPMITLQRFSKLKMLRLFSNSYVENKMHCPSGSFPQLEVLKLWKLEHLQLWTVDDSALPELTELEIRTCKKLEMLPVEVQGLRNLKILKLVDLDLKSMHCYSLSYPQLQLLEFVNLEHLKSWTLDEGALPQLIELEIRSCRQLDMLPEGLQHISSLKVLKVREMPLEFTSRIEQNHGPDWYKIANVPTREIFKSCHGAAS